MAATVSELAETTIDTLYTQNPGLVGSIPKSTWVAILEDTLTEIIGKEITLGKTRPDFEFVVLMLNQSISQLEGWKDLLTASTSQALVRMIASGITYGQYSIERALQEAMLRHASSPNSIIACANMMGVRMRRKIPATIAVTLTRTENSTTLQIPAYSQFTIESTKYFNRTQITIQEGFLSANVELYQGLIVEETIIADGEPFQIYNLGTTPNSLADEDIEVTIDNKVWTRTTRNPWVMGLDSTEYFETTDIEGNSRIQFGNSAFGKIPQINTTIYVRWVETLGYAGNANLSGLTVRWDDLPTDVVLSGTTTSAAKFGDDEVSIDDYRELIPHLRAANNDQAVRRSDYRTLAFNFSGVRDALFRGQAELAPGRRSMMNVIGVTLLTENDWTTADFEAFATTFKETYGIYQCEFLNLPPTGVGATVSATVYCSRQAELENIKAQLTANIETLFEPKMDHLGYSIYLSDINDVLNGRNVNSPDEDLERNIEYVVLDSPTTDLLLDDSTQYAYLESLTLTVEYTSRGGYRGRLDLVPQTV